VDTFYPFTSLRAYIRPHSLWFRLALPFVAFVALGSSALVVWLHLSARQDSLRQFAAEARANAEFVRTTHLPTTARTADSLGRVLRVEVGFAPRTVPEIAEAMISPAGFHSNTLGKQAVEHVGEPVREGGKEAIVWPVGDEWLMWFIRSAEPGFSVLLQPRTLAVLGGFWLLALALAWALSRGIVTPLRLLASRLPQIENDPEGSLPGAERNDEIGQVARAYLNTRNQLGDERVRREQAERLALLGRMATGLAHEIHNPLSAIRMHAQLLESSAEAELPALAKESLPLMLGETVKIESLVSQWMFLARPEPPKVAPLQIARVIENVLRTYEPAAQHAAVSLSSSVDQSHWVSGDSRRIEQAVSNVVLNAIQAMADGGELKIEAVRDGERVRVHFADSGPGFSNAALERHSELFFSEREGGMGIGLAVTSEILRAHSGAVRVENGSRGATVTFDLPNTSP
jgi:signal transduction histidine kinase